MPTEAQLFKDILSLSGKAARGPQPPYCDVAPPLHPDLPVDYEQVRDDFFSVHLGESDQVYHPPLGLPHIDVYRYPPVPGRCFWCYVTNGMSDFPQLLPDGKQLRLELILCTRAEKRSHAELARWLGEFPFVASTFLSANHTLPAPPGALSPSFPYLLMTPPFLVPEAASFPMGSHKVLTISCIGITSMELEQAVNGSSSMLVDSLPDEMETWLLDGRSRGDDLGEPA